MKKLSRDFKIDVAVGILGGAVTAAVCAALLNCSPKPVATPNDADATAPNYVEAGTQIANGVCTLLEGVTQNQTVITICATVEEVAAVVAFISTFLRHGEAVDAGVCTVLPASNLCATKQEIGQGITLLVNKRQLQLLRDSGAK
jgi:hypothetical protein